MGALQPGLPSPVAIPKEYYITVIDLQDCFFTINLYPEDCKRFAFSIPSVNHKRPCKRYQWKVLPQGMKNSPTLCQKFVDLAIQPIREKFPEPYLIHYMDDILIGHKQQEVTHQVLKELTESLIYYGLLIAPDKIQQTRPLHYLGHVIKDECVTSQHLQIRVDKFTL